MNKYIFIIYDTVNKCVIDWFCNEDECIEAFNESYVMCSSVNWLALNLDCVIEYAESLYNYEVLSK